MNTSAQPRDQLPLSEGAASPIARLLEEARKRLIETGTRNRLVHVNRKAARANVINIVNERSDDVFRLLWNDGKRMSFQPLLRDDLDDADDEVAGDTPKLLFVGDDFDKARYTDNRLEVRMKPDALQKRLLRLARDASTAESEQGINILYLALGFLTWYEDKSSSVAREAPLILLPVELKRNARTSTYDLVRRDDDLETNLPLRERLLADFGIKLPEIEDREGWAPTAYFDEIEAVIASRDRWTIDRDGMQLGFFSFAKLLMLRDLEPKNWTGSTLSDHGLVRGLLHEGFQGEPPLFGKDDNLDEKLEPAQIIQVIDADASQTKVIEEVRAGRNLVVQGPPGTGKSQTITNVIAAAVHDGKRVLFVAEKMAALNVVHDRIVKVGLRHTCLELHSRSANKKAVLAEIGRTMKSGGAIPSMPGEPTQLKAARDKLNSITKLVHRQVDGTGESPFSVIGQQAKFAGNGSPPPSIQVVGIENTSRALSEQLALEIRKYSELVSREGGVARHPFRGVQELHLQPVDLARASNTSRDIAGKFAKLASQHDKVASYLEVDAPGTLENLLKLRTLIAAILEAPDIDRALLSDCSAIEHSSRLEDALNLGAQLQASKGTLTDRFADIAWNAQIGSVRGIVANGQNSILTRIGPKYRRAGALLEGLLRTPLPKRAKERLALIDSLLSVQHLQERLGSEESLLKDCLGPHWRGEGTSFGDALKAVQWALKLKQVGIRFSLPRAIELASKREQATRIVATIERVVPTARQELHSLFQLLKVDVRAAVGADSSDVAGFHALAEYLSDLSAHPHRYDAWKQLQLSRRTLRAAKLELLLDGLDSGRLTAESAATEFLYGRAEAIWKRALQESPELNKLTSFDRQQLVRSYQELERRRFDDVKTMILARHLSQLPQGAMGQMSVIRGELGKQRAHKPIRQLMTHASEAIQRIKPVFLMSPISVAQFLPPGKVEFDLLIIDEASQVRPEDALGAIARCKQIVVVGDQKQLPPTSFFDRLTSNVDDDEEDIDDPLEGGARATELESILSLCEARGLPARMLEWHYRSRDPSLITVSNAEFYEHGLILPPSPLQNERDFGLLFTRVNGVYDRGGRRTNTIEAQAVVRRLAEHARTCPELSVGAVAFSSAQRSAIEEFLEFERRRDTTLDEFLREGKREDIFVKNIENVQGDERDVILVSVGYGPDQPNGRLLKMNFGPVNKDGGERRLNVLFTRARLRCEVFASFDPGDIDLNRTQKTGPRVLKRYLEFAKTGILDEKLPVGLDADTPFESDVANVIRKLGYLVDHQVGSAGFRIDLGIRHPDRPGQYILAVECDGATYHSALWARERDRLRQAVLEGLNWHFHRIWSTDWFYRRDPEVERLRLALESARNAGNRAAETPGANVGWRSTEPASGSSSSDNDLDLTGLDKPVRVMPLYERFTGTTTTSLEPHEVHASVLAELATRIIRKEGPIHRDEVARRIASSFGKERTGRRISDAAYKALQSAKCAHPGEIVSDDEFWFTAEQAKSPPIRDRSMESGPIVKADALSPLEIGAALALAINDSAGASDDELVRAAARMMGFRRVGPDIADAIAKVLESKRFGDQ